MQLLINWMYNKLNESNNNTVIHYWWYIYIYLFYLNFGNFDTIVCISCFNWKSFVLICVKSLLTKSRTAESTDEQWTVARFMLYYENLFLRRK